MKVAIFGQYYQNDTRPIIKDIFVFFNRNNVELVIEEKFLEILYKEEIVSKKYNTFASHEDLDRSFDILISIGGDGTINKKDKSIVMSSVSKDLLIDVQQILNILNIYSFITKPTKIENNNY